MELAGPLGHSPRKKEESPLSQIFRQSDLISDVAIQRIKIYCFIVFSKEEINQRDMAKAYTSLHRAQSFKTEDSPVSQVFRPSELISGDLIGKGFFGDVVKVRHFLNSGFLVPSSRFQFADYYLDDFIGHSEGALGLQAFFSHWQGFTFQF